MAFLTDIRILETGNGGDIALKGSDLLKCFSFENMPYLGFFGGNPEQSTPSDRVSEEQAFDYWGNNLFFENNSEIQFNSQTERVLYSVQLNSRGRILIENAVKEDLKFMEPFANVDVSVSLIGLDKVEIFIKIVQPENGVERQFLYIWDGAILIEETSADGAQIIQVEEGLQENLQFNLG